MRPKFIREADGIVRVELGSGWRGLQDALEDSLGTRPPQGHESDPPSTFWLDRVLALMHRSDGSRIELSSGNMSRLILEGSSVTASADYDTFDDVSVDLWDFEMLLRAWRRATLEAASRSEHAYNDDYATCFRTHATLRVFVRDLSHDAISRLLGCDPTSTKQAGDPIGPQASRDLAGWFLDSAEHVESRDLRRHVDFVLDSVDLDELAAMTAERGAIADVFCFWESKSGHGGPELEPGQMSRFVRAGIGIGIDVYFSHRDASAH